MDSVFVDAYTGGSTATGFDIFGEFFTNTEVKMTSILVTTELYTCLIKLPIFFLGEEFEIVFC